MRQGIERLLGSRIPDDRLAYHSRAQARADCRIVAVVSGLETVVEAEGLIGVLKIYKNVGMCV